MALTSNQRTTLLAAIKANATANAAYLAQDTFTLLAWCNAAASPAVSAWNPAVQTTALFDALNIATYDALSQGKRDAFALLIGRGAVDAAKTNANDTIRKGLADIFAIGGGYADTTQLPKMLAACQEPATNAQVAIGGATPSQSGVTALRRNFVGVVDETDANILVNSARP